MLARAPDPTGSRTTAAVPASQADRPSRKGLLMRVRSDRDADRPHNWGRWYTSPASNTRQRHEAGNVRGSRPPKRPRRRHSMRWNKYFHRQPNPTQRRPPAMFHVEHADCGSEKRSLARNPIATRELIGARTDLPEDLVAELGPDRLRRFEPKGRQFACRPASDLFCDCELGIFLIRRRICTRGNGAAGLTRRFRDDQPSPNPKERGGALRHDRRRSEGTHDHPVEGGAIERIPPADLCPLVHHADPLVGRRRPRLARGTGPGAHSRPAAPRWPQATLGHDQTGEPSAGPEIEDAGASALGLHSAESTNPLRGAGDARSAQARGIRPRARRPEPPGAILDYPIPVGVRHRRSRSAGWGDDDVAVGVLTLGTCGHPFNLIHGVVHGLAVSRAHRLQGLLLARGNDFFGDLGAEPLQRS